MFGISSLSRVGEGSVPARFRDECLKRAPSHRNGQVVLQPIPGNEKLRRGVPSLDVPPMDLVEVSVLITNGQHCIGEQRCPVFWDKEDTVCQEGVPSTLGLNLVVDGRYWEGKSPEIPK